MTRAPAKTRAAGRASRMGIASSCVRRAPGDRPSAGLERRPRRLLRGSARGTPRGAPRAVHAAARWSRGSRRVRRAAPARGVQTPPHAPRAHAGARPLSGPSCHLKHNGERRQTIQRGREAGSHAAAQAPHTVSRHATRRAAWVTGSRAVSGLRRECRGGGRPGGRRPYRREQMARETGGGAVAAGPAGPRHREPPRSGRGDRGRTGGRACRRCGRSAGSAG